MLEGVLAVGACVAAVTWLVGAARAEPMLGWFCIQYDVPDSLGARALVQAYLFRTRAWRVTGAIVGLVVSAAVVVLTDHRVPVLLAVGVGWMAAGLIGEVVGRRHLAQSTVPSMLRAADLVPPSARHTIITTGLVTALSLLMSLATRSSPLVLRDGADLPTPARLLAVGAAAAVLAVLSWRGVRSIGEQPLVVSGNDLDLVEHAIRSASAVRVVAGWSALQLVATAWLSWQTMSVTRAPFAWLAGVLALGSLIGAAASWWWMPTRLALHRRPPVAP